MHMHVCNRDPYKSRKSEINTDSVHEQTALVERKNLCEQSRIVRESMIIDVMTSSDECARALCSTVEHDGGAEAH